MCPGLATFITVLVLDLFGLAVDWLLYCMGGKTITDRIAGGQWLLGAAIISLQVAGMAGLAQHFWGPRWVVRI